MKLRLSVALICIAAFVSGISAQQPAQPPVQQPGMGNQTTSTKGAVIKGKAPVNKKLLKVNKKFRAEGLYLRFRLYGMVAYSF